MLIDWSMFEIQPDHRLNVRIAPQQRSVAMEYRNRGTVSQRQRCEEFFKAGRRDRSRDEPQKLAIGPRDLVGEDGRPVPGETAAQSGATASPVSIELVRGLE